MKGLLEMLGFSKQAQARPDPISAQVIAATRRNENAGEKAREAIRELLDANDGAKKGMTR